MDNPNERLTHFGFSQIEKSEKGSHVANVFHSVSNRYDLMNDLMSLGTHRIMKLMATNATRARKGHIILDLAGGTGDLSQHLTKYVGVEGQIYLCDINNSMLVAGRNRLLNQGVAKNISYVRADGEQLPFPSESFNSIIVGFGLRNFTSIDIALAAILECLKPNGRVVILEFSKPRNDLIRRAYYSFIELWPKLGKKITGDEESYRYLVESIHMHPDQTNLAEMLKTAGFNKVRYQNIFNGIVAIHEGVKT